MDARNETLQAYLTLLKAKTAELVSHVAAGTPGLNGSLLHIQLDELGKVLQQARAAAVSAGHRP